jgi:glycosyltransferase involved in cell wall biosynthesis
VNIGFVVHHYDPADGTGGYAVQLVTRLALRHSVTLYAAAVRGAVPDGVRWVRVPAFSGSAYAKILSFPLAFRAVRGRHDVVHAQGWVTGSADVVTSHIVLGAWRAAARTAGVSAPPGERLFGALVTRREAALLGRRARCVIAPSQRARVDIARCYGRSKGVAVIHHGFPARAALPTQRDARLRLGVPAHGFVALYAGDARKGFAAAATALMQAPGVRLLVASHSPRRPYLDLARRSGVEDRVCWPAVVDDIRTAYAAADVLFYPTIYDTFGMVVAEAMAFGIPVIVSPEAGIADLIEHGRSGWILAPQSSDAARALLALRDDPALRGRLENGAREVASHRSWDDVARETEAVYLRAAGEKAA